MISLLTFLAALGTAHEPLAPAVHLSVRAEAMAIATANELSAAALLDAGRSWSAAHEPSWPAPGLAGRPSLGPLFAPAQPEEWVALFARRLELAEQPIARAAVRLMTSPVRVDLSSDRVYVAYRFDF